MRASIRSPAPPPADASPLVTTRPRQKASRQWSPPRQAERGARPSRSQHQRTRRRGQNPSSSSQRFPVPPPVHAWQSVATETSGTWGQAVEVTAPTNAATGTESIVEFTEVSCPASGSCVAVGRYADTAEHGQAMVATETSGTWGRAVEIASPTNAESNPIAFLGSIDCSAPASCTAVGSYQDNTGHTQAMTATNTGGAWTTSELTPVSETNQELRSVSCPETGSCVAVGDYFSAHSGGQIILKQTGGTWERQATGITPPSNAQSGEAGNLISVSCPALGSCVTVGDYFDTSHYEQAMTASEASGGGSPRGG